MMNSASDPFTYYLGDDSEEDTEHQAAHLRAGSSSQEPAGGGGRARRSNARHRRFSEACSSGDDGEDMEERMDYSRMTPESLKRVKRRVANRECARRIRQRKLGLLSQLSNQVERLQQQNTDLVAALAAVTAQWRDVARVNCVLKADLALALTLRQQGQVGNEAAATLQLHRMAIEDELLQGDALGAFAPEAGGLTA